ncbi:hypothetical protein CPAR01_00948 [Colletotrichum paranaense]|uniref:NACHT-NTPase and P-loop NTPases N-terminal domain-containing protein n=1 Tax=Colletotrichum paranaense TaxID=1914294 RepID=A0ABQ9T747_9PEZI|nr:uncharacterized protein CPAR01_00948 [Colletotrichum paranaense]KAK1546981.1 hypothetical protein CPAR01_00948 [Colletotrichum paranaense]
MAEALGLAASVIAVVDITTKVGSATFKLMKLWAEVKEVPQMLLEKAERIKDLEDFLLDAEDYIKNSPLPQAFWNTNHRLRQHIEKVRRALDDVQDMVDDLQTKLISRKHGFRIKLLSSSKVVFRKDELKALDRKLEAALYLFSIAQMQWIMAMSAFRTSLSTEEWSGGGTASNAMQAEKINNAPVSTPPVLFYICSPASVVPTFRFVFGKNDNFQFSIQAPSWLTGSVYSVMAQKSYQGWQFNLRAYEVVKYFSNELLECIGIDDPSGMFRVLSQHNMTPFVRNSCGKSLFELTGPNCLKFAVEYRSLDVVKALLERGFAYLLRDQLSSQASVAFLLYELGSMTISPRRYDLEPTFQKLFLEVFLDDYLDDPARIFWLFSYGIGYHSFQMILKRYSIKYESFPLAQRLQHLRFVVATCSWETHEVCFILTETKNDDTWASTLVSSRSMNGLALFHSCAIGMASNFVARNRHPNPDQWAETRQSWVKLLRDGIKLDRQSLYHIDSTLNWSGNGAMSSPLCSIINSIVDSRPSDLSTARQVLESLMAALAEWISIISSSDVELLDYGREESRMYKRGLTSVWQRWAPWHGDTIGTTRLSLIGITYGSCPNHWSLWWSDDYEDYAGEFWTMVQDVVGKVPGAWVDESWSPVEYDREEWDRWQAWEKEEPTPLIWTEYRRTQPPI